MKRRKSFLGSYIEEDNISNSSFRATALSISHLSESVLNMCSTGGRDFVSFTLTFYKVIA